MKPRDRLVLCVLVAAAAIAAVWFGVVSPKRQEAADLGTKVAAAQVRLDGAQQQLTAGKAAQAGYAENLKVVKALYNAVPATDGVPHLLVALDRTSHHKRVDFKVISVAHGAPSAPSAAASLAGGLSPISFTFTFNGGYIDLQHFLKTVAAYTLVAGGKVVAHGRLLTIQSVSLAPLTATSGAGASQPNGTQASVTASAYSQLPAGASLPPTAATATVSTPSAPAATTAAPVATSTNTTR